MSVGLNDDHHDHPHGIADHKQKANCNGGRGGRGGGGGGGGGDGGTGTGTGGTAGTGFPPGTFPPFNGTLPAGFPTTFPLRSTFFLKSSINFNDII